MEDAEVQQLLSKLGQAAVIEHETQAARLERLRMAVKGLEVKGEEEEGDESGSDREELRGGLELLQARRVITEDSLRRAAFRTCQQRVLGAYIDADLLEGYREQIKERTRFSIRGSQVADDRLPAEANFNEDGSLMVTAGWSGLVSLWSMPRAALIGQLAGHSDRVNSACIKGEYVLSGSADFSVRLWNNSASTVFLGHQQRVNKVLFHPTSQYILSCSHDKTIRMWSLASQREILMQTGHYRGVYCMDCHPDGSLLVSGDLGGVGRVWDLRTGYTVMVLKGHIKQMLAISAAPDGFHLATGSDDCTVKLWDLRKHGLLYTIPAHTKLISGLSLTDDLIATSSYDNSAKLWSATDFSLLQTFPHDNKVTDVCFGPSSLVTCSFDRTFKLWEAN